LNEVQQFDITMKRKLRKFHPRSQVYVWATFGRWHSYFWCSR